MANIIMVAVQFYNDDGDEDTIQLPHTREVCERCEGFGTHLNPSIGEHAYSAEEFAESFDEEGREQYFKRGGIYDVRCERCNGERVINVLCEKECKTEEQKEALRCIHAAEKEERQYRAECEAERRMGC